jgi:hypothetical protein
MFTLPDELLRVIIPFEGLFSKPVFRHVQLLFVEAVLVPVKRTVNAMLRIVDLNQEKRFHKYHWVLSQA